MFDKSATDMASASGSSTTGLLVASLPHASANRMRHTRYRSTKKPTSCFGSGLSTQRIFIRHPKHKLHEVHYARHVGTASGRCRPSGFGIYRRLDGLRPIRSSLDSAMQVLDPAIEVSAS